MRPSILSDWQDLKLSFTHPRTGWHPDGMVLELRPEDGARPAVLLTFAIIAVVVFGLIALVFGLADIVDWLFALLAAAAPAGVPLAWWILPRRLKATITNGNVEVEERLLGILPWRWREDLASYRGLYAFAHTRTHEQPVDNAGAWRGADNTSWRPVLRRKTTTGWLLLVHPCRRRTLPLVRTTGGPPPDWRVTEIAERLGRPILDKP